MIPNAKAVNIERQRFWLLPEKAIYWQKEKTLLVADLHIGKSGHFRKHGIAVPGKLNSSNLENLSSLIENIDPKQLLILGDLFHSEINKEWEEFVSWRKEYPDLTVNLIIGNHDILSKSEYHSTYINLFKRLKIGPFLIVHDLSEIKESENTDHYILSGHVHPAVKLTGNGRQVMKLPCYYFGERRGILPAFGQFTGTHIIEPRKDDLIFIIVDSEVISAGQLY